METKHVLDNSQVRAQIAVALGLSPQRVNHWLTRRVPADLCPDIEKLTGIRCELLRPDVNWAVLRRPIKRAKVSL